MVLVDGPDPAKVFLHYFRDGFDVDSAGPCCRGPGGASYAEVGEKLAPLLKGAKRVWEVSASTRPPPCRSGWRRRRGPPSPTDHNGIHVALYRAGRRGAGVHAAERDVRAGAGVCQRSVRSEHPHPARRQSAAA